MDHNSWAREFDYGIQLDYLPNPLFSETEHSLTELPTDDPPPYENLELLSKINLFDMCYLNHLILVSNDLADEGIENTRIAIDLSIPHPIFPPVIANQVYSVTHNHAPKIADQCPIGFEDEEWTRVWNDQEYALDEYLENNRSWDNNELLSWKHEYIFKGARYRLSINSYKTFDDLPSFTHGKIISFGNCNNWNYKYIIDHCVEVDEFNAYLKVVCYDYCHDYYDICSDRPPLILVVPKTHCDVRMHPNLDQNLIAPNEVPYAQIPLMEYLSATSKVKQQSFWKRLLHRFC